MQDAPEQGSDDGGEVVFADDGDASKSTLLGRLEGQRATCA